MISKKELEILLSKIATFEKSKPELEQYQTPSAIAADILWTAFMNRDIRNKEVADLGSGTGIFAIGASLLGAKLAIGYEADASAIALARKNVKIVKKTLKILGLRGVKKDR